MSAWHGLHGYDNHFVKIHFVPQTDVAAIICIIVIPTAAASSRCGKALALLLAEKEVNDDYRTNDQ